MTTKPQTKLPKRKRTPKQWKSYLWGFFSEYIRRRDAGVCISCGVRKPWKEMHAGHYIAGNACGLSLFFDERNVNTQCPGCNTFRHGNLSEYAIGLERKYGHGILQDLKTCKRPKEYWPVKKWEETVIKYKEKVKHLEK